MSGEPYYPPPDQMQQPHQQTQGQQPPPKPDKSMGKILAVVAVVAIVIIAVIAVAFLMSPGLVGRWEQVSTMTTISVLGSQITSWDNNTGDWIEFRSDGTGTTNEGDEFNWEIVDGQLKVSGDFMGGSLSYTFDYTLKGNELTIRGNLSQGIYLSTTYRRI